MAESTSKEYRAWYAMIDRCYNHKNKHFKNYGGRGIAVCARWRQNYRAFLADVGRAPSRDHSLDRVRNNDGYEPGNVRWATWIEQNNNKRRARCGRCGRTGHDIRTCDKLTRALAELDRIAAEEQGGAL